MISKFINRNLLLTLSALSVFSMPSLAQIKAEEVEDVETVVVPPLFEYVIAPDDLPDLQSRTDYLMDHFWDPFDFKNTKVVDQNALNHAFGVYLQAMAYSSEKKINDSVKKLISKISKNPGLSYQFAKAADENLYGPRAELWGDEILVSFLENAVNNKQIRDTQKSTFKSRLALIRKWAVGAPWPGVRAINGEGTEVNVTPQSEFAIIEFTPLNCEDGPYSNLKLDISGVVNNLIEEGRLEIDIVVLDDKYPEGNFAKKWNIYSSPDVFSEGDIRIVPSFYVVGSDGMIKGKNMTIDNAIDLIESMK